MLPVRFYFYSKFECNVLRYPNISLVLYYIRVVFGVIDPAKPPPGKSAGTKMVVDNVYLVRNVMTRTVIRRLKTFLKTLPYNPIFNPDGLRGQTRTYELYDRTSTLNPLRSDDETFIHQVVTIVISNLDKSIIGDADTGVAARGVRAMAGCKSQRHHPDYRPHQKHQTKCWSVLISVESGTRLEICTARCDIPLIVNIPVGSALLFRGDVIHGGASFLRCNHRFFFKLVPRQLAGFISRGSAEKAERLEIGFCDHHRSILGVAEFGSVFRCEVRFLIDRTFSHFVCLSVRRNKEVV